MPSKVPRALVVERETTAWTMACQGRTQYEIAAKLGISQPAVSQILKRVSTRVLKQLETEVAQRKALQNIRLEGIYAEAMDAWHESKQPKKKSRSKKLVAGGGLTPEQLTAARDGVPLHVGQRTVREETTNEAATCDGNFLFLQTALAALADQRKLWGIDAPKQLDILDKRRPLEKLSEEELRQRAHENAALLASEGAGA